MIVFQIGKPNEFPALSPVEDSKHKVVQDTVLDIGEFSESECLPQEELDQRGLVVVEPQDPQALQDAGDAQVVVSAPGHRRTGIKERKG